MNRIIALTGASGFIGQRLVRRLKGQGWKIRALVRGNHPELASAGIETVRGSLADAGSLRDLTTGAEIVVHLAGAVRAPDDRSFHAVNAEGTARLAEAAIATGCRRFLLVSSLAARQPELSGYAASKLAGEQQVLSRAGRLDVAIIRPPATYGPGDTMTLPFFRQLARHRPLIPGRRDARFSLLYVDDLAELVVCLMEQNNWNGEVIEPDDGEPDGYDWQRVTAIAAAYFARPSRPVFLPRTVLTPPAIALEAAGALFGFAPALTRGKLAELYHPDWVCRGAGAAAAGSRPVVRFADGLALTWRWYARAGWVAEHRKPPMAQAKKAL